MPVGSQRNYCYKIWINEAVWTINENTILAHFNIKLNSKGNSNNKSFDAEKRHYIIFKVT